MSGSKPASRTVGQSSPAGSAPAARSGVAEPAGKPTLDSPLSREAIEHSLGLGDAVRVEVVEQTGSTNDDLLELARTAAPHKPIVRVALHQVAGRGRHGRRWHDARGRALLFSVMTPWLRDPAAASAVTLACGISVAEALRERGIEARLKWPNDLLLSGRKLGGILTELALDPNMHASLVVGLGVNLCMDPETRVAIDQPAAALDERVQESRLASEREIWIALLARAVLDAVEQFEREGFAPFRPRFEGLFAFAGRPVVLVQAGLPTLAGVPAGVDGEGRLLLSTDSGMQAITSGELSLRPSEA
jgi:BirA family transcriptional regulator, biotin operon repressor / biotin---[acetyl-CoA-carboxylase] ligase